MTNLYIDFDGVVANTIDITYKMAEEQKIEKNYDSYLKFYQNLNWKEVLEKCSPINDSYNCIQKIIDSHKFNVSILTHITSLSEGEEKVKLIRKYFNDITIILVPKSISKTQMIKTEGSILVDDFADNLEQWKSKGGYGVKFDLDMDGKGFPVIDRLDVLIDMFD